MTTQTVNKTQFLEYLKKKKYSSNDDTEITATKIAISGTQTISIAELSLVEDEIKKSVKRPSKYQKTVPEKITGKVGIYADSFGSASAAKFASKYSKYSFNPTTVNSWKK